ncbi:MAG: alpha/beta hydrolase [Rhodospirillaceae bacterium]
MLTSFLTATAGVYAALIGVMYFSQRHLMYHPGADLESPAVSGVAEMSPLALETADALTLQSWYAPPRDGRPVLVYFHGNAGHIGDRGFKARPFLDAGMGVMLVGYRGFGGNPGNPTETGLYNDAEAALSHLVALGVGPENWVLYGESLGTGLAVEMAERRAKAGTPVGAVVLEAPFTSMGDAAQSRYPFLLARWLVKDRYHSISKIASISAPLLIFHGNLDGVVPFSLGRRLFEAAQEPKRFETIDGAHHSNLFDFGVSDLVLEFITTDASQGGDKSTAKMLRNLP